MPATPHTAETDPSGVALAGIAGHLAAICDRAAAVLERGPDEIDLAFVVRDLRDVRDVLTVTAGGPAR